MKIVTKKIMLTYEELYLLEQERNPYMERERTPVMDKLKRAGIDPGRFDLMIESKVGNEYVTLIQETKVFTFSQRVEFWWRDLLHYLHIVPSPSRMHKRTLSGDIYKTRKFFKKM